MRILRFTIFIAAAVFTFNALFTFNGTAADTAESSEADASMRCCRERLSDDEKLLYDALVTCALSESPDEETDHITVSLDPAGDEFQAMLRKVYNAVIFDHPEFFWIDGNAGMSGYKALGIWQISLDFTVNADEIDSIETRIDEKANEYLASLPEGASDYDKVKAAYEYIIRTTDYDTSSRNNQNIMSVFLDGKSVCAGYARALQYLLKKAGVWCAYIEGTTGASMEGHAWNLVYIDGVYTYVDPSWGDPTYGEDATDASRLEIIYDYLCLTSDELMRIRHIPTGVYALPECTDTSFDYYRLNGLFYEGFDPDAVGGAVWHAVDEAERSVFFKFSDFESYQMAVDALFPAEGDEAESLLDAPIRQRMEWDAASSMRYYYSCSDELWIIKIYW